MANTGLAAGGLMSGFSSTYFPGLRQNEVDARLQEEIALRKAADQRAAEMQQFQMQKYAEAEAKDRQAAGLYAGFLGIKPSLGAASSVDPEKGGLDATDPGLWDAQGNMTKDPNAQIANPQYEQFMAGGAKAGLDLVKQTREQQAQAQKTWYEQQKAASDAVRADAAAKRSDAILAKIAQGPGQGKPTLFMDEQNRPVYLRAGDDIPAGWKPYDKKAEGNAAKAEQAQQDKMANASLVLEDIGRAKELADKPLSLGLGATTVSNVPGTPAADLARLLDGIKANIGFDKLQAMRAASPTGGALGQVSDMENKLLQSTLGSLQQSQSPAQFKATLKRLEDQYQDIVHGKGNRPSAAKPGGVRVYNPQTRRLE